MNKTSIASALYLVSVVALALVIGCGSVSDPAPLPPPLSAGNVNLIFVVSEDLAYSAPGDMNTSTANLSNQGLQRSLQMGSFLKQKVLGGSNVTSIYALEPMTHLQTANNYPDMVALETIQQFAMLNPISLSYEGTEPVTADGYPILASYAAESLPPNVATPALPCAACQGIDFTDQNGDNEALVSSILDASLPGYYVFSAPWETVSSMMQNISRSQGYNLTIPSSYAGPNAVYAISIPSSGSARLVTYDSNSDPASTYPQLSLPAGAAGNTCSAQAPFHIQLAAGTAPAGVNTNETVYFIRHAEAHPTSTWEDGNYIGAGQWRALALPAALQGALQGKTQPTQVISIDPSVAFPAPVASDVNASYVRPALTVEPYAIANNLPYNLAANVAVFSQLPPTLSTFASNYFFTGGQFSNRTILVAWEHNELGTLMGALLASYQSSQAGPIWPDADYDTIWRVTLDAHGNLSVDNNLCEGINSAALPATPPQF